MGRLKYLLLLFIFLSWCFSPGIAIPSNQPEAPQQESGGRIQAIALTPLVLPEHLTEQGTVGPEFEDLIAGKLKEAGFSVVGSKIFDEIKKREAERLGGYFDPISGKEDKTKLKEILARVREALISKYHIDAILFPEIRVVQATFDANSAHWHGTSEFLGIPRQSAMTRLRIRGTVPALSLFVRIENNKEREIYNYAYRVHT